MVNARVYYRCTVDKCPLRYVQEVYCTMCAQMKPKDGHCHDHVTMKDDDPYLVRYRETVALEEQQRALDINSQGDSSHMESCDFTIGGGSEDMTRFAEEMMKAQHQLQLMREGRSNEIQPTCRQQEAMGVISARNVSPYFDNRSKDSHMSNRLQ